jgi:hypothetical protein
LRKGTVETSRDIKVSGFLPHLPFSIFATIANTSLPVCLFGFPLEGFDSLADLIASYTLITRRTHFVFVPGPSDLTVNSVLPRKPLLASFTARLRSKIPNVHLASNPCRLKFFGQEIVVFRDDVMSRMLRNLVGVKPDARNEDLKRYVCVIFFLLAPLLHPPFLSLTSLTFGDANWSKCNDSSSSLYSIRATSPHSRRTYSRS